MKSVIIYYSYNGNTRKVAQALKERLKINGEVDVFELNALDESDNFFGQCRRALRRERAKIEPTKYSLKQYDLLCFGSPVWAFRPAPAMNTCLDQARDIEDK